MAGGLQIWQMDWRPFMQYMEATESRNCPLLCIVDFYSATDSVAMSHHVTDGFSCSLLQLISKLYGSPLFCLIKQLTGFMR